MQTQALLISFGCRNVIIEILKRVNLLQYHHKTRIQIALTFFDHPDHPEHVYTFQHVAM